MRFKNNVCVVSGVGIIVGNFYILVNYFCLINLIYGHGVTLVIVTKTLMPKDALFERPFTCTKTF